MKGLVLGFGPFAGVDVNPSEHLARSLDGRSTAGLSLVGAAMPVSYARSLQVTRDLVATHRPDWVLGIGVAVQRTVPQFERRGTGLGCDRPDVDGVCRDSADGEHLSGLPLDDLAQALGHPLSEDAGTYVCNGWLHQAIEALAPLPVGFLHIPPSGVDPDALFDVLTVIRSP